MCVCVCVMLLKYECTYIHTIYIYINAHFSTRRSKWSLSVKNKRRSMCRTGPSNNCRRILNKIKPLTHLSLRQDSSFQGMLQ